MTTSEYIANLAAANGGRITPDLVLESANPKDSPIHHLFCWDDTEAAKNYRLIQAQTIIRKIRVSYEQSPERTVSVRAYVNVEPRREDEEDQPERGVYVTLSEALSVDEYRNQLFQCAKRDAAAFRNKYSTLKEVSNIIREINLLEA
jgi:hypothetical protein